MGEEIVTEDIVKRALAKEAFLTANAQGVDAIKAGGMRLVNPDGPALAAEITRLRAQVETMKTALKEIEADYSNYEESGPVRLDRKRYIAQRALSVHRSTGASHE